MHGCYLIVLTSYVFFTVGSLLCSWIWNAIVVVNLKFTFYTNILLNLCTEFVATTFTQTFYTSKTTIVLTVSDLVGKWSCRGQGWCLTLSTPITVSHSVPPEGPYVSLPSSHETIFSDLRNAICIVYFRLQTMPKKNLIVMLPSFWADFFLFDFIFFGTRFENLVAKTTKT